jgi:DNA polymerase III epsilon subunit family exonuclease
MNLVEYLAEENPEYGNLYIDSVVLSKSDCSIVVNFSSKTVFSDAQKMDIRSRIEAIIPPAFTIKQINYSKIYCDEDVALQKIREIITAKYLSLGSSLKEVSCERKGGVFLFKLRCLEYIRVYLEENSIIAEMTAELEGHFKEKFMIDVAYVDGGREEVKKAEEKAEQGPLNFRIIEVSNITPLVGKAAKGSAVYISDCESEAPRQLICGKVLGFTERKTKNEKVMVSFELEDFTGRIFCMFFPSEANYEKVRQLQDGCEVLILGDIKFDSFKNGFVCMVKSISLCELQKDFVMAERPSRPEPPNYSVVFPRKFMQSEQLDLFERGDVPIPHFFKGKKFVVFDIETTGLNYDIDRITEIGAVKIEDGIITETFSTLINPGIHIKEETVKLNGIDDELVKNCPTFEQVLPDFYKFTRGADIVAHNIEFDLKFIKYHAKKYGYYFDNCVYDTLEIAKEYLSGIGLSNYKLNTLCEYFDIDLKDHHRAWNDAMATAKLFIKLYEMREFAKNC